LHTTYYCGPGVINKRGEVLIDFVDESLMDSIISINPRALWRREKHFVFFSFLDVV
jgi:hypothetical protein